MVRKLAIVIALLVPLSGCFVTTGPGLFVAGVATLATTKKTGADHAVSWLTGQDCSSLRYSKGGTYCEHEDKENLEGTDLALYGPDGTYIGTGPYCYRTLGGATCYSYPDPLASEQARLR